MKSNFGCWECKYNSMCGYLNTNLAGNLNFMYWKDLENAMVSMMYCGKGHCNSFGVDG